MFSLSHDTELVVARAVFKPILAVCEMEKVMEKPGWVTIWPLLHPADVVQSRIQQNNGTKAATMDHTASSSSSW